MVAKNMALKKDRISKDLIYMKYDTLKAKLSSIEDFEHRALLSTVYACFGRVGEIVQGQHSGSRPLIVRDVSLLTTPDGREYLHIIAFTEKIRDFREIMVSKELEPWLFQPIARWLLETKKQYGEDSFLFRSPRFKANRAMSYKHAEKIFDMYFGYQTIHLMRSWRASHALIGKFTRNGHPMPVTVVQEVGGWRDSRVLLRVYNKSKALDYMKSLI